jgi:LacI family transcriptional regulator
MGDGFVMTGGSLDESRVEGETARLLQTRPSPTAIIVAGNQLLAGCLRAIRARGLRVGADLSLITCDEVPLVEFHDPPIASVSRDNAELGRTAAQLLLERLTGEAPRTVMLPTTFIPRASCMAPAAAS